MKALSNRVLIVWAFLACVLVPVAGSFAQGDLDGDGTPDEEDPETRVTTSQELEAGTYTFLSLVITNGAVLTLKSNPSLDNFKGVEINAENITIDPTSSISADGQGYGGTAGPGAGGSGWGGGGGAGYGGKGGKGGGGPGGITYGSATQPVDLGSGGGNSYAYPGSAGGGAVRLIVTGTLTNDGVIAANGTNAPEDAGAGSGGSIYVTTNVLSGSGQFPANGGSTSGGGGGGGGRVAIYYGTSTFAGEAEAKGGTGRSNNNGEEGTVGFFDTANDDMYVYDTWRFLEIDGPEFSFHDVTFENAKVVFEGNTSLSAARLILNNSLITCDPEWKIDLTTGDLTIDSTSSISADGKGHAAASGPGTGGSGWGGGGGAGYGGKGGKGGGGAGGPTYGSAMQPVDLGSGGGNSYAYPGSPGGGAVRLVATGTLTNDGVIAANGTNAPEDAGAGSGGSIYVTANVLSGSGRFLANGGSTTGGGGGGGGRVAVYYETSTFAGEAEAKGGTGWQNNNGGDGTVGIFDTLNNDFYAGHSWCFQQAHSPFDFNEVILGNGASAVCEDNVSLTANALSLSAASRLSLLGTGTTLDADEVTITGVSGILGNVHLTAQNVTIDSTSSISADGSGYGPGLGPGGVPGTGWSGGGGAGHGGKGGAGRGSGGGPAYGSAAMPIDRGSGGGNSYSYPGSAGGGAIWVMVTGTLANDGILGASAGNPTGDGGAGSGGSIYVKTNVLSGSGSFRANGGNSATTGGGGGGGGRIAIQYQTSSFAGTTEARGGAGYVAGEDGTVGFFDTLNNDFYAGHEWCFQAADSPFDFNRVILENGGRVLCEDNIAIATKILSLDTGSVLSLPGANISIDADTVTVSGGSVIEGNVHMTSESVTVDSTSAISADGSGYGAGLGPGGVSGSGWSGGGGAGYGGKGGAGRGAAGGPAYGSAVMPVDMGSGGGNSYSYPGSSGGGAIRLVVTGTLSNNGTITASGADPAGDGGCGSGGSVYVTTVGLSGSGSFRANGGNSASTGGGGAAGRIAVYYQTSDFTGTAEAKGGTGFVNGEDTQPILSADAPSTATQLEEKAFTEATTQETLFETEVILTDVAVSGELDGTLSFTELEMVSIGTGSFSEKGFLRGNWNATLDTLLYEGSFSGMSFLKPAEKKIYLKGTTAGDVTGILQGYLLKSTPESSFYDRFRGEWKVTKLKGVMISTTLTLEGVVEYGQILAQVGAGIHVLQTSIEGESVGHYTGPLSVVLTHVRVQDAASRFDGRGFSILSFTSDLGSGEGWTYDELTQPGNVHLIGLFTSPLSGSVSADLVDMPAGRSLSVSVERTDLGLPPMSRLEIMVWGPGRVSPGQKIDYLIEYRNEGIRSAENVEIVNRLPRVLDYMSNTGNASFNPESREAVWRFAEIPPRTDTCLTVTSRVVWGLPSGTSIRNFTFMQDTSRIPVDPTVKITSEILEATEHSLRMILHVSGASGSGDIELTMSIVDAIEEMEPVVDVVESAEDVNVNSEYTFPGSLKKANTALTWGKSGYQAYTGAAEVQNDVQEANNNIEFLNWLLQNNLISPEKYNTLKRRAESRPVLGIVKNVAGKAPMMGDLYSKAVDGAKDVGYQTSVRKSVEEHIVDRMINDPSYKPPFDTWPPSYDDIYGLYRKGNSITQDSTDTSIVVSHDPNMKYGPEGNVSPGQKLDYRVEFENEGEGIAFGVYFTDTLDTDLDDSTLQIGPVMSTKGGSEIAPVGTYNPGTRTITWTVGEVGPHEGGYADLSVDVRGDAPEGTEIINFGIVYFPSAPEVTRTNGIINIVPYAKGSVTALEEGGGSLTLEWEPFGDGQYTVQTTTDLASGEWVDAAGEWPTAARRWVVSVGATRRTYVRVQAAGR